MNQGAKPRCSLCGREIDVGDGLPGEMVRDSVADLIRRDHPDWVASGIVCADDVHRYRMRLVEAMLADEKGEVSELEVRLLSARVDQLVGRQWSRLMEIQQIQMDLMDEIATHRRTVESVGEGGSVA